MSTTNLECKICGTNGSHSIHQVKEMMFGTREVFDYLMCHSCGCLQRIDMELDMGSYYPDDYYSFNCFKNKRIGYIKCNLKRYRTRYHISGRGIIGKVLCKIFGYPNFPNWLPQNFVDPDLRVLDVGCGSGELLHYLHLEGFSNLCGLDPYAHASVVEAITIYKDWSELPGPFDLIMMHHSLEHMADQRETFSILSNLLSETGVIVIRIPIVSSHAWERYGVNWVQIDAPRHFFLHSLRSMEILASGASLILKNIIFDSSSFQFWGSEQYTRDVPLNDSSSYAKNKNTPLFTMDEISFFNDSAQRLNATSKGDQACFIYTK
jgi:2-polyprenyl-3-methyl-5-hydroxy-6-metoxy-1,4-benzoquinol methylase